MPRYPALPSGSAQRLVEERVAKQQKTLLSPATEPARPCNGRFQVYTESVQSGLHAKMRMAENTIMPLLKENFCLEQRERANEVLKEEGIMFRFPLKAKGQRISISSRDVRLMGDGVLSPSVLSPLGALARVCMVCVQVSATKTAPPRSCGLHTPSPAHTQPYGLHGSLCSNVQ